MRSVQRTTPWQIRRLQQSDVHGLLEIISGVRREFGLATRVAALLEPNDYALLEVYRHRRSAYFVAVMDNHVLGGRAFFHWPTMTGAHASCNECILFRNTADAGSGK